MALFSYRGSIPAPLPASLQDVALTQLNEWGYEGPFDPPYYDPSSQDLQWSGSQWQIVFLPVAEREQRNYQRLLQRANWVGFSEQLFASNAYGVARSAAIIDLEVNVICTELIALLADAKAGRENVAAINQLLGALGQNLTLQDEDKESLRNLAKDNGLLPFLPSLDF